MKKVFVFVPDLNGGGAERSLINLLNSMSVADQDVIEPVLVVRRLGGAYVDEISATIPKIQLGVVRSGVLASLLTVFRLGRALRKHRPVAVISFLSAPSVYAAVKLFLPSCKFGISVQTSPSQWLAGEFSILSSLIHAIQGYVFRRADFLLPISHGIAEELVSKYSVPRIKLRVVYNSISSETIAESASQTRPSEMHRDPGVIAFVTAGRLVAQKNQGILLEAFSEVLRHNAKACLYILGEGPEEASLRAISKKLSIDRDVRFLGFKKNPWVYFKHADVFVLSSRYEGFANVLVEAMACGLPVISTDAPHGPSEILNGAEYGLLTPVGDSHSLFEKMQDLAKSPVLRSQYSAKSFSRAKDFDSVKISRVFWEAVRYYLAARGEA